MTLKTQGKTAPHLERKDVLLLEKQLNETTVINLKVILSNFSQNLLVVLCLNLWTLKTNA